MSFMEGEGGGGGGGVIIPFVWQMLGSSMAGYVLLVCTEEQIHKIQVVIKILLRSHNLIH